MTEVILSCLDSIYFFLMFNLLAGLPSILSVMTAQNFQIRLNLNQRDQTQFEVD